VLVGVYLQAARLREASAARLADKRPVSVDGRVLLQDRAQGKALVTQRTLQRDVLKTPSKTPFTTNAVYRAALFTCFLGVLHSNATDRYVQPVHSMLNTPRKT
jgi:hypothetical protein